MKFHLAHIIPRPEWHGLNGYFEVIETVRWGLEQLGHEVSYAVNETAAGARNIVFGAQVLPLLQQRQLPADTIIYNFEQLRGRDRANVPDSMKAYASRFRVWEYSEFNLGTWSMLGTRYPVRHVRVGYAPMLERIPRPAEQDIDVLIYGLTNELRLKAFHALVTAGLTTVFVSGLYGAARDELIGRAKLVVNVSLYTRSQIFEIVRASYLFANRKAVVAHITEQTGIESDIRGAFKAIAAKDLLTVVRELLADNAARQALEASAHAAMARRDIRPILQAALG